MADSGSKQDDKHGEGGLSVKALVGRSVLFLVALVVLVIGGLFALSVIKGNIHYYQTFDGCESGDLDACYDLAGHYCEGEHVAEDDWKCQSLLERNCAEGHARSCTHAGWNYYRGDSDREVEHLAVAIEACEAGDMRGCHVAGSPVAGDEDRPDDAEPRAAYSERACRGGLAAACHQWLWGLEEDGAAEKAVLEAAEVGCEKGHREACIELGALRVAESARASEGRDLLERHCPTPDDRCFALVDYLEQHDASEARAVAEELCVRGVEPACGWLGERADDREPGRVDALMAYACQSYARPDCEVAQQRAERHGERCAVDAPVSCEVYARFLARNRGEHWDYERYRYALGTACDGGMISSCSILAYVLRHTEAERDLRERLRRKACEHGFSHHCGEPREVTVASYPGAPDPERLVASLEAQCEAGRAGACEDLVGWYAHTLEIWMPRKALQLAERYGDVACERGDPRGCSSAAIVHLDGLPAVYLPDDIAQKQADRYRRACRLGYARACLQHGLFYLDSDPPRNPERGKRILEDYCRGDHPWICWRLVRYYRHGEYVEKNPERAMKIEQALCDAGAEEACDG